MTRYLISFEDGTMVFPDEDLPEVARAAHAVLDEAKRAGVYLAGGGVEYPEASVVAVDGTVSHGPFRPGKERIGGFVILRVASHDEALEWAHKFAVACRCAQDVRALMDDPEA